MRYSYLFFDLDRTLWDYESNARNSLKKVYDNNHLSDHYSSPDEFYLIYTRINDALWEAYRQGKIIKTDLRNERFRQTLAEKGVVDEDLSRSVGDQYMEITPRMTGLFPNTIETLQYLKARGYRMFILTNGFLKTQEKKMKNSRIDTYFEKIFSSEEIGINKPHREIFHWSVTSLNARKSECLMIGDDIEVDIKGALGFGMDAVLFDPAGKAFAGSPYRVISDLADLRDIL